MASRAQQKQEARDRRLAEERAAAERASRQRRLQLTGGVIVAAIIVIVVAIVVSSSGGSSTAKVSKPTSPQARSAATAVNALLAGIPQNGNVLGSPSAKVTVTEYGDLVCPVCRDFALSSEDQLIKQDVRTGKVKLVYKALETASATANNSMFVPSQVAALAAGQQKLGWNYIELFYQEQGDETQPYVTNGYLQGLASQISGLNLPNWQAARNDSSFAAQVTSDEQQAAGAGYNSTPTIVASGPKGQAQPIIGDPQSFSQLQSAISQVS
jgi:protein-disulfide isomerase